MKTILLLIFIVACSSTVFSQERIDPPKLPRNFNDTNFYNRTFNHFLIGWNNGGPGVKMDNALNMNACHVIEKYAPSFPELSRVDG